MIHSRTRREILRRYHDVEIGKYSYGAILRPGALPGGTRVGAYCSVGRDLHVLRRNHPVDRPFLHPFFYNASQELVPQDMIATDRDNPLSIGNDVWIGDRVTILGGCRSIGNGAVIAAGAVVASDVAPYAIVGGVPAKLIRMRFSADRIAELERTAWWTRDISDVITATDLPDPFRSLDGQV
jgi:acetyltransferase-like isoleucine patch superfamily enzyme